MRLIYGTGNRAKLLSMREMLAPLPLEIEGIESVLANPPAIDESGNDPLENAVIKATAYYGALRVPVFSCDSGLYIEGLDPSLQPGAHVRNVGGKTLTDDEMLLHYAAIAKSRGGECRAAYRNAICLVYDENHIYKRMDDAISGETFLLSAIAHKERRPGFPLDSLSVHIGTGRYYFDMNARTGSGIAAGFQAFFRSVLKDLGRG